MLDFLKRGFNSTKNDISEPSKAEPLSVFARFKEGLKHTRKSFANNLGRLFLGKKEIDATLMEALRDSLLRQDVGVNATEGIMSELTKQVARNALHDAQALKTALKENLKQILEPIALPLNTDVPHKPFVILMVGVNGTGKTTTIGKLAKKFQGEGKKIMLAAGDTFRAAAIEQLVAWGERNQIPVIAQYSKADSASVIFDAFQAARARNIDILIADTAGRLHTQDHLMSELKKVVRVLGKIDAQAPHEIMLVLDAGIGQNALVQAQKFHEAIHLTGLTLTKLDGTAKGGIIFSIAKTLALPIRFVGLGEGIDDLKTFEAENFVNALFSEPQEQNETN